MEIIESSSRQYAFTLRRTNLKKGVSQDDYQNHLKKWSDKGQCEIIDSVFEYEAGLHMHGILEIPKQINFNLFRVRGWNIKLEELYDKTGWKYYMMKSQKSEDDNESEIKDTRINIYTLKHSLFRPRGETASDV